MKNRNTKKNSGAGFDLKPIMAGLAVLLIPLIVFIFYRVSTSNNNLIPISVLALIFGAIIENKRLTEKWSTVLTSALFSFLISFAIFIPGKHETVYVIEDHIEIWPYAFLFLFVINSAVFNKDKIIPRLSEGITLILSVGIIYWVIDHGFYDIHSKFIKFIMFIGFIIAIFSIINAFANFNLTQNLRLFLSIWSSIIMTLLAIDNIYNVYQNGQVEETGIFVNKIYIGLQYFLLGVCSVYIVQNIMMLVGFLPDKYRFFNAEYFKDIKALKKDHVERYSENQSGTIISLVCLVTSGVFFGLNYRFDFMSRNIAIWIVFFILNNMVFIYDNLKLKTTANKQ